MHTKDKILDMEFFTASTDQWEYTTLNLPTSKKKRINSKKRVRS
jgi:hypothetical protein